MGSYYLLRPVRDAMATVFGAIGRPSREICFTVVEQESRYKTRNIIDVVVYRFGDLASAWVRAGLRWGASAGSLGMQHEQRRASAIGSIVGSYGQ